MANAESIRQTARSRAPLSTWLAVVLIFALFGVIVLAIIGPMPRGSDYEETRAKKRIEKLNRSEERRVGKECRTRCTGRPEEAERQRTPETITEAGYHQTCVT